MELAPTKLALTSLTRPTLAVNSPRICNMFQLHLALEVNNVRELDARVSNWWRRCRNVEKMVYKGKVFYGQKPHCGESSATKFMVNYQLLEVIY